MRRLIWVFAGRICSLAANAVPRLTYEQRTPISMRVRDVGIGVCCSTCKVFKKLSGFRGRSCKFDTFSKAQPNWSPLSFNISFTKIGISFQEVARVLMLSTLNHIFCRRYFEIFFLIFSRKNRIIFSYFSQKNRIWHFMQIVSILPEIQLETICMKRQYCFLGI